MLVSRSRAFLPLPRRFARRAHGLSSIHEPYLRTHARIPVATRAIRAGKQQDSKTVNDLVSMGTRAETTSDIVAAWSRWDRLPSVR